MITKIKSKKIKKSLLSLHQKKVFYWQKNKRYVGFFLEMRLGKTRLSIICVMADSHCFPCLIFCPYSAIDGWINDLIICGNKKNIDFICIDGIKDKRIDILKRYKDSDIKFFLVNKESHLSIGKELSLLQWGAVIIDESTCIKNYDTYISQYFTKNFRNVYKRIILSGTPMPENELDIYQQIEFLDHNIFNNINHFIHFRNTYFKQTRYGWAPTIKSKEIIAKKLAKCCYTMSRKDAGLYVNQVYEKKILQLKSKTMKTYRDFVKNFILEYDSKIYKVTDWVLSQYISLRQLCGGFVKDSETLEYKCIDDSKFKLLIDLIKNELINNQIIIWCSFNHEIDYIHKLLNKYKISNTFLYGKIKKSEISLRVKAFQNNKIKTIICQPSCFEEGTTLNKADTTIYYSSPVGGKARSQTEARMNNPFIDEIDLIIDLVASNTVDERILQSNLRKENNQLSMLNLMKYLQKQFKEF